MKQIDITPRAHEDLVDLKAYLLIEFGETSAQKVSHKNCVFYK